MNKPDMENICAIGLFIAIVSGMLFVTSVFVACKLVEIRAEIREWRSQDNAALPWDDLD